MKIVQIVTRLNVGGPALHVVLLNMGLRQRDFDMLLLFGRCENQEGDMSYLLAPGTRALPLPLLSRSVRPWDNLRALWRIFRALRQVKPHLVHTHTAMAGCLGRLAAMLAGVPVIVHTFHGNSLRGYFSPVTSAIFLRIERLLARFTDAICVLSEQQLQELSGEFRVARRSKFRVVPLGLDLSDYAAVPPPAATGDRLRVGWIGRLVPVKNIPLLVDAMEAAIQRSAGIEFHIAGDGEDRDLLRRAVERLGDRLVWHGWVEDVVPLLSRCDVLLQTSRNEGTPVALIQGMAAGRPFVSTAVGGVVDMVQGTELRAGPGARWFANGVLVEPDPAAIARVLLELAQDRSQILAMGLQAREFASTSYRSEALLQSMGSLYRELIRSKLPTHEFDSETSETSLMGMEQRQWK